MLKALNVNDKAVVVTAEKDEVVIGSANNLQTVKVLTVEEMNVLDLLAHTNSSSRKMQRKKQGRCLHNERST